MGEGGSGWDFMDFFCYTCSLQGGFRWQMSCNVMVGADSEPVIHLGPAGIPQRRGVFCHPPHPFRAGIPAESRHKKRLSPGDLPREPRCQGAVPSVHCGSEQLSATQAFSEGG
jgi:hypothetical protein